MAETVTAGTPSLWGFVGDLFKTGTSIVSDWSTTQNKISLQTSANQLAEIQAKQTQAQAELTAQLGGVTRIEAEAEKEQKKLDIIKYVTIAGIVIAGSVTGVILFKKMKKR